MFSEALSVSTRHSVAERLLWVQNIAQEISGILKSGEGIVLACEERRLVDRIDDVLSVVRKSISATGAIESLSDDAMRDGERAYEEFEAQAVSHELSGALERDRTPAGRVQVERVVALRELGLPSFH